MDSAETSNPASEAKPQRDLLLILVAGVLICFFNLGQEAEWAVHETRHAVIAAEMAESGDFLVPRRLGELYPDKPPTMHVAIALLYRAFGKVSMGLARTPSAVAGIVGTLALYGIGMILHGRRVGLFAGLALLGTLGYADRARIARPDMVLGAAIVLASLGWLAAMRERGARRPLYFALGGLAAGLATLTKGPWGILFPLFVIVLAPIRREDLRRPRRTEWVVIVAALLAIPLAWAIPVYFRDNGEFLRRVIFQPELLMEKPTSWPLYWYLGPAAFYLLPWTLFLALVVKNWRRNGSAWIALAIFVALSCVKEKKANYLVPWYPFVVLAVATAVVSREKNAAWRKASWGILVAALVFMPIYYGLVRPWRARGEEPERAFAAKVLDTVPAGSSVIGYMRLGEAVALVGYERDQSHRVTVVESRDSRALAQRVKKAMSAGKPCYLMARKNELERSLAFTKEVRPELLIEQTWGDSTWRLYRLWPSA